MARRRTQEGSLFKRGTRKKVWVARWREWVKDEDGALKRVLRSEILGAVSELTKSDAKERLRQKLGSNQSKKDIATDITFKVFVERWWKPAMLPGYKVSTRFQAEQALKNYLIPKFGDSRLSDIKKPDVQAFLGGLLDHLSPDTVHGIHRYLRRILSCALEWD